VCYASVYTFETLLTDGLLSNLLGPEWLHKTQNFMKLCKIPFLLWCMHPMSLGSEVLAKNVLGNLTRNVNLDKSKFVLLFNLIIAGATIVLVYLIFFEKSLTISQLKPWQVVLFQVAYPLIGSVYSLNTKGDLMDDNFYLMYWIVFSLLKIADRFFLSHIISFLTSLGFIDNLLSYLGLSINEFWVMFKLLFLIWCYSPLTRGAWVVWGILVWPLRKIKGD